MASPPWSWILQTWRVERVENNLRVVWRGSQRVNTSVCVYVYVYVYVCMYVCMYVIVKCGGIVGGGGTIKQFHLICLFIVYLLT